MSNHHPPSTPAVTKRSALACLGTTNVPATTAMLAAAEPKFPRFVGD